MSPEPRDVDDLADAPASEAADAPAPHDEVVWEGTERVDGSAQVEGDAAASHDDGEPRGAAPRRSVLDRVLDAGIESWLTFGIVVACVVFVADQLHPELILRDTTPNGGDMGAHVWAPAYLRDHLLPQLRLTGWTPDWYAGFPALHFYMVPPMLAIVVLDVVLPYGIAFKLVAVSGALALPVCCWTFGRLAGARFPGPALFALGGVVFLFSRDFSIYGGNLLSTLAGEFSFTISLCLAVLYLGLLVDGLQTGRHRGWAALVLGLCALTHVIPLLFAIVATAVTFALFPSRRGVRWLLTTTPVAALLALWWLLPFWWQRAYLNDMGWEKLVPPDGAGAWEQVGFWATKAFPNEWRWARDLPGTSVDLRLDIALVVLVGVCVPLVRRSRLGVLLIALATVSGLGIWLVPQGRLWNARVMPFAHLFTYLAVAFGVSLLVRWYAEAFPVGWRTPVRSTGAALVLGLGLFMVAFPLHALPFGRLTADGAYRWLWFETTDRSHVPGWARWNFSGYEAKDAWPEFEDVLLTMEGVGETRGCGRAMWEYSSELDRYGTPMALMLLPYFTDGCIGSMEGLYFESSATTPFHFLNQSALSVAPSRPQRGLAYGGFDLGLGVQQLQMLGVRYYMAESEQAIRAASRHLDLTEVARTGPWVVFEVADSELVVGLDHEPAVLAPGAEERSGPLARVAEVAGTLANRPEVPNHEWIEATEGWWMDPDRWDVLLASDGPQDWQRVSDVREADPVPVEPVEVTAIESDDRSISFDVSEVGRPVLVRASYFPNWRVSGADGPWRVSPNLMVVVPTGEHVELTYGRSGVELVGGAASLVGVALLVLLFRAGPLESQRRRRTGRHSRTDPISLAEPPP